MNQQTWNYSRNHWKSLQEPQEMCRYYSSLTLQLSVNFKILFVSLWSYQLFWHNFFPLSVSTDHKALSFWFLKQSFVIFCCLNHRRILLWDGIVQSVCGDFKKRYFLVFFLTGNVLYMHNLYIVHEELLPFFTWRFSCCSRKYSFDTNYHRKQSSWTTISTETLLYLYQPACILRSWGRNLLNGPASLKSTQFFSVRVFFPSSSNLVVMAQTH